MLVHGGCWRAQYGRDLEDRVAADLAARGLAVWNVEYRRLDCGGDWPAPLDDVVAAATALPQEIDPARVALAGHSAGGHLALLAANRVRRARRAGAGAGLRPAAGGANSARAPERSSGCSSRARPRRSTSRPTSTCCSSTATPTAHVSVELSRAYARSGHAVYVELVGCGHMEHLDPASDAGRLAGNWLERLLA